MVASFLKSKDCDLRQEGGNVEELRKDVVVAGGGVILGDHGRQIISECTQIEDAASEAHAVAASKAPSAAVGFVKHDNAVGQRKARRAEWRRSAIKDAPAQSVSTIAAYGPCAADGLIALNGGVGKRSIHAKRREESATLAAAAVAGDSADAGRAANAAHSMVVVQYAVAHVEGS